MADYTAARAKHATLTSTTVDNVTLSVPLTGVSVINRGTVDMYAGFDGVTASSGGDNTYYIGAGDSLVWFGNRTSLVVSVIGNGNAYSVQAI